MKHPDIAALAKAAFEGSGVETHKKFADLYCCGLRSLRAWLAGEKPASAIAQMVLRQAAKGWRPK